MQIINLKYGFDNFLLGGLILFSMFFPRILGIYKLPILLFIVFYGIFYLIRNNLGILTVSSTTSFFILYFIHAGMAFLEGFAQNNPGVIDFFRVNILYYIFLYLGSFTITDRNKFKTIIWACHFASIAISLYTFLFISHSIGVIRLPSYLVLCDVNVGFHDGYLHIVNTNLSMLIFLFPFTLMMSRCDEILQNKKLKLLNQISIISSASAMFLSGRRIVWIVLIISLFFFFYKQNEFTKKRKTIMGTISLFFLVSFLMFYVAQKYEMNLGGIVDRFTYAFSSYDEYNRSNARYEQMTALFNGFLENPIFGSGAGIGVEDCIRSSIHPWQYELSYNLKLYNSGIIGTLFYFLAFFSVSFGLNRQKNQMAQSLNFSFICGLIANATNPYVSSSFDFLWWIFIPIYYLKACEHEDYLKSQNKIFI